MKIIFISGDGHGAGKTYLAQKFANGQHQIFSIANTIRWELAHKYKKYDWYNKSPTYKEKTIVTETNMTIKQMLDSYGREKKSKNPIYWAEALANSLLFAKENEKLETAVIDDLRFVNEFNYIKSQFPTDNICHIHVINPNAILEPHYENDKLKKIADYHIKSNKPAVSGTSS